MSLQPNFASLEYIQWNSAHILQLSLHHQPSPTHSLLPNHPGACIAQLTHFVLTTTTQALTAKKRCPIIITIPPNLHRQLPTYNFASSFTVPTLSFSPYFFNTDSL